MILDRLTHLSQSFDLNNCQDREVSTLYSIRILNTALCCFELLCESMKSQREKALFLRNNAKIARSELLINKFLCFNSKIYLRSIIGNLDMNSRAVIRLSEFRRASTIAEMGNHLSNTEMLNLSCEETQLQSFLQSYKRRE